MLPSAIFSPRCGSFVFARVHACRLCIVKTQPFCFQRSAHCRGFLTPRFSTLFFGLLEREGRRGICKCVLEGDRISFGCLQINWSFSGEIVRATSSPRRDLSVSHGGLKEHSWSHACAIRSIIELVCRAAAGYYGTWLTKYK